jgi:hypothetical protein
VVMNSFSLCLSWKAFSVLNDNFAIILFQVLKYITPCFLAFRVSVEKLLLFWWVCLCQVSWHFLLQLWISFVLLSF